MRVTGHIGNFFSVHVGHWRSEYGQIFWLLLSLYPWRDRSLFPLQLDR